nr:hypothetical protein [Tanacetum cinerariifolium]
CRDLTARKSVRLLPSHHLALRHTSPVTTIADLSSPLIFVYPPATRTLREVGVDVVARIDISDGMLMPDAVEHLEQGEEVVQDIYGHTIKIPLQRLEDIKTGM